MSNPPSSRAPAKPTLYVSGPMSNQPLFNYPLFHEVTAELRAAGYAVENPAENSPPACGTWEGYMRLAVAQLVRCDGVALLPGWELSKGATLEVSNAQALRMPCKPWQEWLR